MNFRSPKLRKYALEAPHCMSRACRAENHGQIVGAHSNKLAHGKGKGIKAHDIVAYLCNDCHDIYDGRKNTWMDKAEREMMFQDAVYESILWLLQTGRLKVE